MILKHIIISCTTALSMISCATEISNQPAESPAVNSPAETAQASPSTQPVQSTESATQQSGTFASGEHETIGTVRIVTESGKRFLELEQDFKTSTSGPDLFVILHRSDDVLKSTNPPAYPLQEQDYAVVGRLQSYSGAQRYPIPDSITLEDYQSAVIWCRMFNATFGAAELSS